MGKNVYLEFPHKTLRAKAIKKYMLEAGIERAVCFSCGNASRALKEEGIDTIDISPTGALTANKWFTPAQIKKTFKNEFDATSGHLPLHLMQDIATNFKWYFDRHPQHEFDDGGTTFVVPTGSGETIICLQMAYPRTEFKALYNLNNATMFEELAPLNNFVENFFDTIKTNK